jgi:hypothetical protein
VAIHDVDVYEVGATRSSPSRMKSADRIEGAMRMVSSTTVLLVSWK